MNFRENLHFLMESKDIQIKELSVKTGISENTIKTYLRSASAEPKLSKAVLIAKALGVSVEFLANGSELSAENPVSKEVFAIQESLKSFNQKELKIISAVINALKE